ncbi:MAG: hypothetical protein RLY43_406 [Bacteroidota bacterium]|jgi:hypothetical protein
MSIPIRKVNYLNNKDILQEIHKSKSSYCSFTKPEYHQYDIILHNVSEITEANITEAKHNKAKRLYFENQNTRRVCTDTAKATQELTSAEIQNGELIFRIMSYDHIPLQPGRKKNPKREADKHVKLNFPPFQHWKFDDSGILICVGKSHWRGDLLEGEYDLYNGKMTDTLARMIIKISERYATRGNLRSYTYNDEMRGQAILQLTQVGLQFDESKSDNPFSYFSTTISNSFVRVLNKEKRNQNIRDDILEMNGMNPSYTRTNSGEHDAALRRYSEDYE